MKVLIVSHAYVEETNRRKLELLAFDPGMELGVIYPRKWRTWHGEDKKQLTIDKGQLTYVEHVLDTFNSGDGGRYFYNPIQLIISILKFKPDLIHVEEEPFSIVGFQLSVISLLFKIKLTFFSWENIVELRLGWLRAFFEKVVFRLAVAALAGTKGAKERLEKRGFSKSIEVVPQFGVDTDLFSPNQPPQGETLWSQVVIGFVGRPTLDKGIDILLEAVSKLPETFNLLWVTTSSSIPLVITDQIKSLGIESRVRVELNIPHEKLVDYYRQMDLYVLPSRTTPTWKEQFGRTALEAMACGVPVIGSSSGAIPEILGGAGLVFEEENSVGLGVKIESLVRSDRTPQIIEAGLGRVRQYYSAGVVSHKTYDFFRSLN